MCIDLVVAIAAVNRFAVAGLERDFCVLTAFRADGGEHLSYRPVRAVVRAITAGALLLFPGSAAGGATLRFIGITSVREGFLLTGAESKRDTAI